MSDLLDTVGALEAAVKASIAGEAAQWDVHLATMAGLLADQAALAHDMDHTAWAVDWWATAPHGE
jgi:hypothetical protein